MVLAAPQYTSFRLPSQERRALRERQKVIEEAEEAKRRRVTVTVDLLGRQVIS